MLNYQKLVDPGDEMIMEPALDQLVENVGGDELADIRVGEVVCERLLMCECERRKIVAHGTGLPRDRHHNRSHSISLRLKSSEARSKCSFVRGAGLPPSRSSERAVHLIPSRSHIRDTTTTSGE